MKIQDFFLFCGSFLPSWIRIRNFYADPDPATQIKADPDPKPWVKVLMSGTGAGMMSTTRGQAWCRQRCPVFGGAPQGQLRLAPVPWWTKQVKLDKSQILDPRLNCRIEIWPDHAKNIWICLSTLSLFIICGQQKPLLWIRIRSDRHHFQKM